MSAVFEALLKMSFSGVLIGTIILAIKYIFQKMGLPRRILFFLWAVIALRLLCPVIPNTDLSVMNITKFFSEKEAFEMTTAEYTQNAVYITAVNENMNKTSTEDNAEYISYIWITGVAVMLSFSAADYLSLKKKLRFATVVKENIYTSDAISTALVCGIVKPTIYIPYGMNQKDFDYVIAHEKMHIQRKDYLTKIFAYVVLSVHWFNPFVWLFFKIFSEDTELVCDECTILKIGEEEKENYINSLLSFAKKSEKKLLFYSVTFSANPIKKRCVNAVKVKKSKRIINVMTGVMCILVISLFGTDATEAVEPESAVTENVSGTETVQFEIEPTESFTEAFYEYPTEVSVISQKKAEREKTTKRYSYKDNLKSEIGGVYCDKNGNISVSFDLNAEIFLWIRLYEEDTGKQAESIGILADNSTMHVFTDCDKNKSYKIVLESPLGDVWKVEGSYTVY